MSCVEMIHRPSITSGAEGQFRGTGNGGDFPIISFLFFELF